MKLSLLALFAVISVRAEATSPKVEARVYSEFVLACVQAFDKSSGNGTGGLGQAICQCTAKESKLEKVSTATLKRETVRIRKDPKNKIEDPGLLSAFQNCSIQVMEANS